MRKPCAGEWKHLYQSHRHGVVLKVSRNRVLEEDPITHGSDTTTWFQFLRLSRISLAEILSSTTVAPWSLKPIVALFRMARSCVALTWFSYSHVCLLPLCKVVGFGNLALKVSLVGHPVHLVCSIAMLVCSFPLDNDILYLWSTTVFTTRKVLTTVWKRYTWLGPITTLQTFNCVPLAMLHSTSFVVTMTSQSQYNFNIRSKWPFDLPHEQSDLPIFVQNIDSNGNGMHLSDVLNFNCRWSHNITTVYLYAQEPYCGR